MQPRSAAVESSLPFRDHVVRVKEQVDAELEVWMAGRIKRAGSYHEEVARHAVAVKDLVARGGKRLRPALCAVGYAAFGGDGGFEKITPALVSLELLQAYLLIHDDWMDGDEVRRGGPSAHAALGVAFGSARAGAVAGVLAGDLAAAYALEALGECPVPAAALAGAFREMAEMQHRVVLGQVLDVRGVCRGSDDVERMHDLKTASYTVRGPLRLGAALAGASDEDRASLDTFASTLGIAFQLRDDLLGLFGDPTVTGKPRGSDLREGKRTAVVARLASDPTWAARLEAARSFDPDELSRVVDDIEATGARAEVESRIEVLTRAAEAAVTTLRVTSRGGALLRGAITALVRREH